MDSQVYWFITVFEKCEQTELGLLNIGARRCWGFYPEKETAYQALHENWTDMWETIYDYAVIEPYYAGISNMAFDYPRQFFKYNRDKDGYFEINTPKETVHYCGFAIG